MLVFTQVAAGTATPVLVANAAPAQGANFILTNGDAANPVFIGSSTAVTATTGAPLPPYGIVPLRNVVSDGPIYAIATGGTVKVGLFYGDLR